MANGPGGLYLSTVRQGWKCSIPCKFPDSLLRVKHTEQNAECFLDAPGVDAPSQKWLDPAPSARGAGSLCVLRSVCEANKGVLQVGC